MRTCCFADTVSDCGFQPLVRHHYEAFPTLMQATQQTTPHYPFSMRNDDLARYSLHFLAKIMDCSILFRNKTFR